MNWVDRILKDTAETESPERYWYWSMLSVIAASMRKNVYLERHIYKLYPNIYVFLIGKSGIKKSPPVNLARKISEEVSITRIIHGRASVQAVLKDLGKAYTTEGGEILKHAHGYMISGELGSFLVKDNDALTILTDLYDTHAHEPTWVNNLKVAGKDTLREPCLTLLGASNETHFHDAVPNNAISGGFVARTMIVLEERRKLINDLLDAPETAVNSKVYAEYIKEISKIKGEFKLDISAKHMYRDWYKKLAAVEDDDVTGTLNRFGDTVLKVAMLVSLAHDGRLIITEEQMQESIDRCMECLGGLRILTMGSGDSELAKPTKLVIRELINRPGHTATRAQLLSKYWGEFDAIVLDRIADTLVAKGAIETERIGKHTHYKMHEKIVSVYREFKKEIN